MGKYVKTKINLPEIFYFQVPSRNRQRPALVRQNALDYLQKKQENEMELKKRQLELEEEKIQIEKGKLELEEKKVEIDLLEHGYCLQKKY